MAFLNRDGAAGTLAALKASNPAGHVPLAMTVAHQLASTAEALGHVAVHADAGLAADTLDDAHVHLGHIVKHGAMAADHHGRLTGKLAERDAGIGAELEKLKAATPEPVTDNHMELIQP